MSYEHPLTFGERACGVTFNPGQHPEVAACKQAFASLVDAVHGVRMASSDPDVKRMASLAITDLQTAEMWTVKAISWVSNETPLPELPEPSTSLSLPG